MQWIDARRSRGRALVVVAREQHAAIVAVRGSVNVHNFVSACKIWPHRRADVPVAVRAGYAEVADELLEEIEPLLDRGLNIHLTGHSLGGAVSTILALRLKAKGFHIAQVVAFGMPLVIWGDAAGTANSSNGSNGTADERCLDLPLVRVEHPLDPVVHFPAALVNFPAPVRALGVRGGAGQRYHPVGRRVSIGDEAPTRTNKNDNSKAAVAAATPGLLGLRSVAAHRLRSYSAECTSRLSQTAGV